MTFLAILLFVAITLGGLLLVAALLFGGGWLLTEILDAPTWVVIPGLAIWLILLMSGYLWAVSNVIG